MFARPVLRVLALVATLGQLQQLPAAVACAAHHARPVAASHCGAPAPADGPAAAAASHDAGAMTSCAGMPCVASAPAAVAAVFASQPGFAAPAPLPARALSLSSISYSPPSPPPQA